MCKKIVQNNWLSTIIGVLILKTNIIHKIIFFYSQDIINNSDVFINNNNTFQLITLTNNKSNI